MSRVVITLIRPGHIKEASGSRSYTSEPGTVAGNVEVKVKLLIEGIPLQYFPAMMQ
jgi:hypothetical protein